MALEPTDVWRVSSRCLVGDEQFVLRQANEGWERGVARRGEIEQTHRFARGLVYLVERCALRAERMVERNGVAVAARKKAHLWPRRRL